LVHDGRVKPTRAALCVALVTAFALPARAADAADDRPVDTRPAPTAEQPFLYLVDPHGPAARQVMTGYSLAFSSNEGAIRPIPGHFDAEGVVHTLALEVGVLSRLRLYGTTMIAQPIGTSDVGAVALQAGARVLLTPPAWQRFRLMLEGAFLREFGSDVGLIGEVTGTYDLGRVRLAMAVHAEHLFAAGRDAVDLYSVAGASVRVLPIMRVGVEYVAQDLEAAFEDEEAEGGARHYVGPDVAFALHKNHLLLTAGTAVQIASAPGILARATLNYVY
jgi:hypothetical protein